MNEKLLSKAEIDIAAPPDKVWHALTDPDLITQYLFGTRVTTDWKVGSPITYTGEWKGKPYEDKGRILEVVPGRKLVSTYWSALSGVPDQPEYYKTVTYELAPRGQLTHLILTQDNNETQEEAEHSTENWKMVLEGLKRLLEG